MAIRQAIKPRLSPAFLVTVVLLAAVATAPSVAAPAAATISGSGNPVNVELFEGLEEAQWLDPDSQTPISAYSELAFGFVRIPTRFSRNALPLDRSVPFTLKASILQNPSCGSVPFPVTLERPRSVFDRWAARAHDQSADPE